MKFTQCACAVSSAVSWVGLVQHFFTLSRSIDVYHLSSHVMINSNILYIHVPSSCEKRTMNGALRLLVRLSLSFLVVGVLALTSVVGSFLNRGVGGFIYFGGPRNESDPHYVEWYWSRQVLSKAYFALPTGLLVVSTFLHAFSPI